MQDVIARRTRSYLVAPKENQNIKGVSPNNHFELHFKKHTNKYS